MLICLTVSQFPKHHSISWQPKTGKGSLNIDGLTLPFEQIRSVFWSRAELPVIDQSLPAETSRIAKQDSISMLKTFFGQRKIAWVNSWNAIQFHQQKPLQLHLARKVGAMVPETYTGNCFSTAKAFCDAQQQCIFKPVYGGAFTQLINKGQFDEDRVKSCLKQSPVTLQSFIAGRDVRTFVIGDKVFSGAIHSDSVDYRQHQTPEIIPIELPDKIQSLANQICEALGMAWTAIDWRLDDSGNYWFLEANPSPMFIFFEQMTGFPNH